MRCARFDKGVADGLADSLAEQPYEEPEYMQRARENSLFAVNTLRGMILAQKSYKEVHPQLLRWYLDNRLIALAMIQDPRNADKATPEIVTEIEQDIAVLEHVLGIN